MRKIRVGLIGCGDVSPRYAEALQEIDDAELVLVMDVQKKAAQRFAEEFNVAYTDNMEDLISDKEIEMVIVAVPHYLHALITIQAARVGKIEDRPTPLSGTDGLKCLEVVLSIYRAGREGKVINIA